jgi:hypothetical protein
MITQKNPLNVINGRVLSSNEKQYEEKPAARQVAVELANVKGGGYTVSVTNTGTSDLSLSRLTVESLELDLYDGEGNLITVLPTIIDPPDGVLRGLIKHEPGESQEFALFTNEAVAWLYPAYAKASYVVVRYRPAAYDDKSEISDLAGIELLSNPLEISR